MSTNIFGFQSSYKPSTDNSNLTSLSKKLQTKVDRTGDLMTGELNMSSNKISGLSNPTLDKDACNKNYVDELVKQVMDNVILHVNSVTEKAIGHLDSINKKFEVQIESLERESFLTKISTEAKIDVLEESLEQKFLNFIRKNRKNRKRNKSE